MAHTTRALANSSITRNSFTATRRFITNFQSEKDEFSNPTNTTSAHVADLKAELKQENPDFAKVKKSIAELDEELRQKMAGLGGEGDAAGVEYEDGKPADLKRSVKNNMFRYI